MAERRKNMVHDKWSARFWIFILCCGFFMLLLAPPGAFAQDSVTGLGIEVHATFHNVGIQVTVSGDDNSNAAAHLEVSVGGGNFAAAHDLSRADAGRFVGSAFLLPQDTGFGVRVTLEDRRAHALHDAARGRDRDPPRLDGGRRFERHRRGGEPLQVGRARPR
jgi:hypothetical protein